MYLETLSALIEAHAARGAYEAAIDCGRRYLAVDDLAFAQFWKDNRQSFSPRSQRLWTPRS